MAPMQHNRTRVRNNRRKARTRNALILLTVFCVTALLVTVAALTFFNQPPEQTPPPETEVTPTTPAKPTVTMPLPQTFVDNNTSAEYIVLYDVTGDKMLYGKNEKEKCYPASTTKLLTSLVTLKYAKSDTVFTVGDEIRLIDPQSSVAYLRIGHRLDLQTMLEAIMLPSGNDAAYTAAANVGRIIAGDPSLSATAAIARFCEEMNKTAKSLGATHSHFANPDGIHDPNHYTTAADLAKIAKAALKEPLLAKVVGQEKVVRTFLSGESGITWYNTNALLRTDQRFLFEGATGMKTGHTDQAGYCLAASAERNGVTLLAIVMNCDTANARFEDASGLFTVCYDAME